MTDRERWARVESLFHEVVDLSPEARRAWLLEHVPEDPELREDVLSLAAFAGSGEERPDHGAWEGALPGLAAVAFQAGGLDELRPGDRVGSWKILREVGRGGMGTVYLAERSDGQYRARAALKVIRAGAAGPDTVRRFRAERQILAGLEHPNVARLLDGGGLDDGRPWLALEYVDGKPLNQSCDDRRLGVAERVALFLQVCDAVAHAHRKLVVHRDVKPGNVLVTAEGVPKLLDFGIAKLLESVGGEDAPTETQTHLRVMTPAYASPEQVRGEPVTTATDVYALGLLLFEILSGGPAQRVTRSSQAEVEQEVCYREPTRPSARLTPEAASARGTTPDRLARMLRGDLDNIVLTALRKEPERRYPSVDALAEDLRRWQEGLPVSARRQSWGYRTGKFARRHALPLAVAGVSAATLLGAIGYYTGQLAGERDRARVEAERANEVADFLTSIFQQADPVLAPGPPLGAREILDRGAERIASLDAVPEVRAGMLQAIGNAYQGLGEPAPARPLLEEAVALRRIQTAGDPGSAAGLWDALDALGSMAWEMGELEEAERIHGEALNWARDLRPPNPYAEATSRNNMGKVRQAQGRHQEAGALFSQALEGFRASRGPVHPSIATALANQAQVVDLLEGGEAGESLHREAIEVTRALPRAEQLNLDVFLSNLAMNLMGQGRLDEAEPLLLEAMAEAEARYGADSPRTINDLSVLARLTARRGDAVGAEVILRRALPRIQAWLGPEHPDVAYELSNLAAVVARQGRPAEADSLHQEAVRLARRVLADDNPLRARALNEYGQFLLQAGRRDAAIRMLTEALEVGRKGLPPGHAFVEGIEGSLRTAAGGDGD